MAAIELTITPDPGETLDQNYARRKIDDEWAALQREVAASGEGPVVRGVPGRGTEDVPAAPPPAPAAPPPAPAEARPAPALQPSSIAVALETALATARDGILTAVKPGSLSMQGAKEVFDGLMQVVISPLAGVAAGLGQQVENIPAARGAMQAEFLAGGMNGPAFTLRHLAMGAPDVKTLTPEQVEALSQPMTGREALEFALQMAPLAGPGVKRAGEAVRLQAPTLRGERGALGPEPPPAGAQVRGAPEAAPAAPPGAPAPGQAAAPAAPGRAIPLAPQLAGEQPAPPVTPAINPRTLGTPAHVSQAITELDAYVTERLATHRATKAQAETVAGAKMTLKQALDLTPETAYLSEEQMAAVTAHFEHAAEWYDTVRRRYAAGHATPEQLDAAWAVAYTLAVNEVAAGTNAGRALNIRGAAARARALGAKATPEQILATGEKLLGGLAGDVQTRADALAQMTAGLGGVQRRGWFRTLAAGARAGRDLTHQLWINNILSGIETQFKNVFGTITGIGVDLPETLIAEIVRPAREAIAPWSGGIIGTADPSGVQFGATAAKLNAILKAKSDIIRLTRDVREGREPFEAPTPFDRRRVRSGEYGFDPDSDFGRFIDTMDGALNSNWMPTRWMRYQDAALKGVVYRMEMGELAARQAKLEGLEGAAFGRRVMELEREPPQWMIHEAQDQALLRTLNQELGRLGQDVMRVANQIPLARVVVPFMQTPTNSGKWAVQRLPGLSLLSQQNWSDLAAGGARADKALARMALGNAVASVVAWQVWQGNVTGGGHPNKALRSLEKSEKPPYSIRVGDQWVKCDIDPACMYIRAIADFVELYQYIPDQQAYEDWAATAQVFATAFGHTFIHSQMLGNLRDTLNAIEQPGSDAGRVLIGTLRGTVPTLMRDITRLSDENIVRDLRSVTDVYKSAWPSTVSGVPPIRNHVTGEPFRRASGWPDNLVPIYRYTTKPNDPVMMELGRVRVPLSPVPWSIYGANPKDIQTFEPTSDHPGVKLAAAQRDFWIVQMTQHPLNGQTLHQALGAMMTAPRYTSATDATRRLMVRSIYSAYREMGLARLLDPAVGSPTLRAQVEAQMQANAQRFRRGPVRLGPPGGGPPGGGGPGAAPVIGR
jgi:hypothetical protein